MKWNGTKLNKIKWHGMEWNEMKWNAMTWNGMERNERKWNGMKRNETRGNGMEWNGMKRKEMKSNQMKSNETKWVWNEMTWNEMVWNGMKWNETNFVVFLISHQPKFVHITSVSDCRFYHVLFWVFGPTLSTQSFPILFSVTSPQPRRPLPPSATRHWFFSRLITFIIPGYLKVDGG